MTLGGAWLATALMLTHGACAPAANVTAAKVPAPTATAPTPTKQTFATGKHRVGSEKLIDSRERTALAPDTLANNSKSAAVPKTSAEIYRAVGPATVIVRVGGGMGSGVVIDPAGWVLTNHHVIDGGKAEDFVLSATVLLGVLSKETGAVERTDKEYRATVYKADKLRDIALLKIDDPPAMLASIPIATRRPVPGDGVTALGHAGAGMLWAIKSGQISALGKLSEHLATLATFDATEDGTQARESFQKYLDKNASGMVIQTTLNILPGDSGGPLVNDQGELVGLNVFSRRDLKTGGQLSFHVHHTEVTRFVQDRPKLPVAMVPDPWLEGGADLSWDDADLDGQVDVLMMTGRKPCSICPPQSSAAFIDTDQDSFTNATELPSLSQVFDMRAFDAEVVLLQRDNNLLVWYDSDNDGIFDRLLSDEGANGDVQAGYEMLAQGALKRLSTLSSTKPFQAALLSDPTQQQRFTHIARAAYDEQFTDSAAPGSDSLLDPIGKGGIATTVDLNRDGRPDGASVSSALSWRLLIDADQNMASSVGASFNLTTMKPGTLDPEVALVIQGQRTWTYYDSDDDGRFDLLLHAPRSRLYAASEAWTIDAAGNRTASPEHIGRKLVRGQLLKDARHSGVVQALDLLSLVAARDDGLGSFPDPVHDHRGAGFELVDVAHVPANTVVVVSAQGSDGHLVDLDGSSRLFGPREKIDTAKVVQQNRFGAEFAYFHRNGLAWTFYDHDGHRGYDIVLVSTSPATGKTTVGYRVDKAGARVDPALAGTPLIQHALVATANAPRMKRIAEALFAPAMREP